MTNNSRQGWGQERQVARSSSGLLWCLSSLTILWWIWKHERVRCPAYIPSFSWMQHSSFSSMASDSSQGTGYVLPSQFWKSILNFKRSHQFVAYDASLDHHTISTLLSFEPSWCCSTMCNPSMWPPIRTIQFCSHFVCEEDKAEWNLAEIWTDHARRFSLWILVSGGL